ncbi:MAG: metal ABC transporter permease [Pseudomonadota bacterium]
MIDALALPFQLPFMQMAFAISGVLAAAMALLSCFMVLKGWSLMGDAISHAVLPGVVIAYILAIPLAIGAFVAGMICAVATGYLSENSRVKEDTVMGVVFSGMFALGIVLYSQIRTEVHLDDILFGDMLGIFPRDLIEAAAISAVVSIVILAKWRDLLLFVFDPAQARTAGLPVGALHYGFLALLSLAVVAALKAVGIILAIALLIAPGATAFLVARSFGWMLMVAVAYALVSALLGVYLSFFLDSAPAPTIVLLMTLGFIAAFVSKILRTAEAERRRLSAPSQAAAHRSPG